MGPRKLLIVDLEATCWERPLHVPDNMETIEIGALVLDPSERVPAREFQTFVRPQRSPLLSAFCTQLTGIKQSDIDTSDPFPVAVARFLDWLGEPAGVRFSSWGEFDRRQIERDCRASAVPYPFLDDHLNLKHLCSAKLGIRPAGMAQALARSGLALEGAHHRALDDARNIARIVAACYPGGLAELLATPQVPRA